MKKLLAVSTLVAALLLAGGCGSKAAQPAGDAAAMDAPAATTAGVLFEKTDLQGDDNGPGTYTYPTDKVFVDGAFDLLGAKIAEDGDNYVFTFTAATDFKNDWKNAGGWDVQLIDIYMNLGTGKNKQTLSGRHVKINEGWDVAIMVGPDKPSRMRKEIDDKNTEVADDVSDFENLVEDIFIPDEITTAGKELTMKIAKDKIGDLSKLNGVQVFMLGSEGFPTKSDTYNRVVNEYSAQWRCGGGSDYDGDPNVIDILGDNAKLADYKSDEGVSEYPTVNLIK